MIYRAEIPSFRGTRKSICFNSVANNLLLCDMRVIFLMYNSNVIINKMRDVIESYYDAAVVQTIRTLNA